MRIEPVEHELIPESALALAIAAFMAGELVAIPTDTVYGLAADVSYTGAADRIFAAKRRSRDLVLPVLVADVEQALSLAVAVPELALRLMERFWPGALTIVLPRNPEFVADLGSDEDTIGIRCPAHFVPRILAGEVGPIATTSANLHGQPPLTEASDVATTFADSVSIVIDGGTCTGAPSTVIDMTGSEPKLLREGRIPWTDILAVLQ